MPRPFQHADARHDGRVKVRRVDAVTRAPKEEALELCSAWRMKSTSISLWVSSSGDRSTQHVQEVTRVVQVRVGRHGVVAVPDAVVGCHDGGALGREPQPLADRRLRGVVFHLRVEGRQGRHAGAQGVQGMAVLDQPQHLYDIVRNVPVGTKGGVQLGELGFLREGGVEEEVDDLFEGRLLRQVVDVVTPVEELTHLAIDEARLGGVDVNVFESPHDLSVGHGLPLPWGVTGASLGSGASGRASARLL